MRKLIVLAAVLAGCATAPQMEERLVLTERGPLREVLNVTDDMKCGGVENWAGCYDPVEQVAYYRPYVKEQTLNHERAHHEGFVHGPWEWNFWRTEKCALILKGARQYIPGDYVCVDKFGEFIRE